MRPYPAVDAARAEAETGHPTPHSKPEGPQRPTFFANQLLGASYAPLHEATPANW